MNKAFYYIRRGDIALFYMINDRVKCRFFDVTMPIITHLGSAVLTIGFANFWQEPHINLICGSYHLTIS